MSVDIEKARAYLRGAPPGASSAVAFCEELLTELEQLRAEMRVANELYAELADEEPCREGAVCHANTIAMKLEQLRAELKEEEACGGRWHKRAEEAHEALSALVDALPKCSQRWWDDPRGQKTPPDAWCCNGYATNVYIGADGDESYYCDAHFQHEYVVWAEPLRAALRLLGRTP